VIPVTTGDTINGVKVEPCYENSECPAPGTCLKDDTGNGRCACNEEIAKASKGLCGKVNDRRSAKKHAIKQCVAFRVSCFASKLLTHG
jgi:hypothetical protein